MNKNLPDPINGQIADLYKAYRGLVFHHIRGRLQCDNDQAEDLTEEVFARACSSLQNRSDPVTSPKKWLIKIADNVCTNQYLKHTNIPEIISLSSSPSFDIGKRSIMDDLIDNAESLPERIAEQHELGRELHQEITALPPEQARAIRLHYGEGLTFKQIAEEYPDRAFSTVAKDARRGLEQLRVRLIHIKQ